MKFQLLKSQFGMAIVLYFAATFQTRFFRNASEGLLLSRCDLTKMSKIFNFFGGFVIDEKIKMFKVAKSSAMQAKIMYASCPAYLQRQHLRHMHVQQISK